jgi:hypothetical protein
MHPWREIQKESPPKPDERTCKQCQHTKPLARFERGSRICRDCRNANRRQWRKDNPGWWRARDNEKHQRYLRERYRARVTQGQQPPPRRWWGVLRTSAELGHHPTDIRKMVRKGVIKGEKYLGRWAIDPASVAEYARWRGIP